jgi:hypothetical protein
VVVLKPSILFVASVVGNRNVVAVYWQGVVLK